MSEYQYYEFLTVDTSLSAKQQRELRKISSRAEISSGRFVNEYQWGDLKAEPEDLVARYFDLGLYVANWGSRRLLVRLPRKGRKVRDLKKYRFHGQSGFDLHVGKSAVVFDFRGDAEGADDLEVDEATGALAGLTPIRQELRAGDLRPLYLGWLAGIALEGEPEDLEPPAPAGLGELTPAQGNLAEFLNIDPDLLAAAAEGSPPGPSSEARAEELKAWIRGLPVRKKDTYLWEVASGESSGLLADFEVSQAKVQRAEEGPRLRRRRIGELLESAGLEPA